MLNTDYQKQALDFLKETETEFKAEFLKHGKHFDDDKETRDIYKITLKRGSREYSFNFGQSLAKSRKYKWIEFYGQKEQEIFLCNGQSEKTFGKKHLYPEKFNDKTKFKLIEGEAPTAYDVLTCLTKYEVGAFENFCSEFGYNTDSRKAEKTYKAVLDEYTQLKTLYNDNELEKMGEIQ